jgi:hypothetical protein
MVLILELIITIIFMNYSIIFFIDKFLFLTILIDYNFYLIIFYKAY